MLTVRRLLASLVAIALSLTGIVGVAAQEAVTPELTVEDQELTLTVATVMSDGPGWVVVHADDNGSPGDVIGVAPVEDGENTDVEVPLDATRLTETVYVMLHTDAGTEGTFEFPDGDDVPAEADGQVVVQPLTFTMPEQLPETGEGMEEETPEATETPEDEVEATETPEDEDEVEATETPEDEDEVEATETPEDEDVGEGEDDDEGAVGGDEDEDDDEGVADDEDDDEVLPETGANVSLLPMLGLAAAGALLLGVGFVFAYRKRD